MNIKLCVTYILNNILKMNNDLNDSIKINIYDLPVWILESEFFKTTCSINYAIINISELKTDL